MFIKIETAALNGNGGGEQQPQKTVKLSDSFDATIANAAEERGRVDVDKNQFSIIKQFHALMDEIIYIFSNDLCCASTEEIEKKKLLENWFHSRHGRNLREKRLTQKEIEIEIETKQRAEEILI